MTEEKNNLNEIKELSDKITGEIQNRLVGSEDVARSLVISLLVGGHVLIEGFPGTGKTLVSNLFSKSLDLSTSRIQSTADLMPADITGTRIYNPKSREFEFREGPIFANIIVVDEINRSPPKSQSALLECMQEKQVSADGVTSKLDEPFMVIATKNALELEGTYPLPEAQLDRFLFRLVMKYPDESEEVEILNRSKQSDTSTSSKIEKSVLLNAKNMIHTGVKANPNILSYIADIVRSTNEIPKVVLGGSPRSAVALLYAAKGYAAVTEGRNYVVPDDVKAVSLDVLNHRLLLRQDALFEASETEESWTVPYIKKILTECINNVAVPS